MRFACFSWVTPPRRIALVAFLFSAAVTGAFVAMPFFVFNELGGGAMMTGMFTAVQAVFYAATSLVSARYVARARHGLAWAVFGVSGFLLFMSAMPAFRVPLVCGALFTGAFTMSAFAWPALHSWVGAEPRLALRARAMGMVNVGWSTGGIVGPLLAGPLYVWDYRFPFVLVAVFGLLSVCVLLTMPRERAYYGVVGAEALRERAAHDHASEAFLYCAWTATFASYIFVGAARGVFPKRLDELVAGGALRLFNESVPPAILNTAAAARFSWLVMAMSAGTAGAFLLLGRAQWWHHRFSVLVAAQAGVGCAAWLLGHTRSVAVMAACFMMIGVNLGVAFFASGFYGMADPARKHGRAAINEGVVGLGGFSGSMGFAWMAERYGIAVPFHWAPLLTGGLLAVQWLLIRHGRRRTQFAAHSQPEG